METNYKTGEERVKRKQGIRSRNAHWNGVASLQVNSYPSLAGWTKRAYYLS